MNISCFQEKFSNINIIKEKTINQIEKTGISGARAINSLNSYTSIIKELIEKLNDLDLKSLIESGKITLESADGAPLTKAKLQSRIKHELNQQLQWFAHAALLIE